MKDHNSQQNASQTQHHKDETQDCMIKQIYLDTIPNHKGIEIGIQFEVCMQ
jgi:hypothetical protein